MVKVDPNFKPRVGSFRFMSKAEGNRIYEVRVSMRGLGFRVRRSRILEFRRHFRSIFLLNPVLLLRSPNFFTSQVQTVSLARNYVQKFLRRRAMCEERAAEHGTAETRLYKSWSPYHRSYRPHSYRQGGFQLKPSSRVSNANYMRVSSKPQSVKLLVKNRCFRSGRAWRGRAQILNAETLNPSKP